MRQKRWFCVDIQLEQQRKLSLHMCCGVSYLHGLNRRELGLLPRAVGAISASKTHETWLRQIRKNTMRRLAGDRRAPLLHYWTQSVLKWKSDVRILHASWGSCEIWPRFYWRQNIWPPNWFSAGKDSSHCTIIKQMSHLVFQYSKPNVPQRSSQTKQNIKPPPHAIRKVMHSMREHPSLM